MKFKEKILFASTFFLGGVVVGFLIAPIKKGIYCGNNNGNYLGRDEEKKEPIEENNTL